MATIGRTNIFALFLYKCLQMLSADGILAFIIPTSIYNCSYYQPTRTYIAREFTILHAETLQDAAFYGTDQETALLIIKKAADPHKRHIFTANDLAFISPNPESLSLLRSDTTIKSLGLSVKTGNIVWNQVKGDLHETDGTLLIYSSNIANGELTLNNLKGDEKKQYVKSTKEAISEPVILVERGYGNSYSFNSIYVDLKYPFYAENHVNVIYGDPNKLQIVAESLKDERTQQFIKYFIGNGSVSKTDLETIVPIFL
jgi:hypothetical protein